MDTPWSDGTAALPEGEEEPASKVAVAAESSSTTVEDTWCRCRRRFVVNGDIFSAIVSLLLPLSITEADEGPVDKEAPPVEVGVKATTAAVSMLTTSVASVKTAAEKNVRLFVRFVFVAFVTLLLLFPQPRARRHLFLLVSFMVESDLIFALLLSFFKL